MLAIDDTNASIRVRGLECRLINVGMAVIDDLQEFLNRRRARDLSFDIFGNRPAHFLCGGRLPVVMHRPKGTDLEIKQHFVERVELGLHVAFGQPRNHHC